MSFEELMQRTSTTSSDLNPYNYIFKWFQIIFSFVLLPYYTIFLIWYFEMERKAMGWRFIKTLPFDFLEVILSKLLIVLCYLAISILIAALSFFFIIFLL
jgi:hypothetical protein